LDRLKVLDRVANFGDFSSKYAKLGISRALGN
jgi:hypothetical protein